MQNTTGTFTTKDQKELFYQAWLPEGQPQAVMAIVHGVGEHSGRYQNFVNAFPDEGIALFSYDQRGEGRSPGQRSHVMAFREYTDDLDVFLNLVESKLPEVPLFLYGHSMGSLISLKYLLEYPRKLAGAIISGTALETSDAASPALVAIARLMSKVAPTFKLKMPLDGALLSRDPQVGKSYNEDPFVHWERSARWGTEMLKTTEQVKPRAKDLKLPVLFVHGEKDPILNVSGAEHFYEECASTDKTLRIYPGGLHEPHNDTCRGEVIAEISTWIKRHI